MPIPPMSSRERVAAAVAFAGPDRVPFQHFVFPGAFWRHGQALVDLLNTHPDDFECRRFAMAPPPSRPLIGEHRDEWGSVWRQRSDYTVGEVIRPALASWDAWPSYVFPPPPAADVYEEMKTRWSNPGHAGYRLAACGNLFERMQWLRGTENLLVDIAEDRQELHELAERLVERGLDHVHECLEAGADCCAFSDDWGAQDRLLMHPDRWRQFFKPLYRRLFQPIRDAGRQVWFHTDGWTADIWDDLIQVGVTVLNPQHAIMPRDLILDRLAGRVCVRSDLDRQGVLPFGTPEEVRAHVADTIALFGRFHGGLILHGEVGPDVPLANVRALLEAYRDLGPYPLRWLAAR